MIMAWYEPAKSDVEPEVVVVDMGDGDKRALTVNKAQHLMESLGMALLERECLVLVKESKDGLMEIENNLSEMRKSCEN